VVVVVVVEVNGLDEVEGVTVEAGDLKLNDDKEEESLCFF